MQVNGRECEPLLVGTMREVVSDIVQPCMCLNSIKVNIYEWKCLNTQLACLSCILLLLQLKMLTICIACIDEFAFRMQHHLELEFASV